MPSVVVAEVKPARRVKGRVRLGGDKSISHRYAMLAALADGVSTIESYSSGADCLTTLQCMRKLGVELELTHAEDGSRTVTMAGRGLRGLQTSSAAESTSLDAENSGTTMRLLTGVLAAQPFSATMTGDDSLRKRPMRRVIEPLQQMGAVISSADGFPPLVIRGSTSLRGIRYHTPVPSAQIKSAILLAGIQAEGVTTVTETIQSRNHTELAFRAFGAQVDVDGTTVSVSGGQRLTAGRFVVPGDVSSAAFWLAAAAGLPGSDVEIENVGLNPTRTALLDVLRDAGAVVDVMVEREAGGEPSGRVRIRYGNPKPLTLGAEQVPLLIDEIPALAAWAAAGGELHVTGAGELRLKESDRISALVRGFRALGGDVDEFGDGFHIRGDRRLKGGQADAVGDHRLAMAFAIAALGAEAPSTIYGADSVGISYPEFFATLGRLCE
jgi:3-phosphoshikimate 1-carboxyvinyltransferase